MSHEYLILQTWSWR